MNKSTTISIIIAGLIIAGVIFFNSKDSEPQINPNPTNNNQSTTTTGVVNNSSSNVSIINGVQIIELTAKGGYSPRKSVAQAGIPTVIRFETSGTFDCSLSVRIPSLNLSQFLPQTGNTDIDLGSPKAGLFRGSCGMGMYPFEVDFQ